LVEIGAARVELPRTRDASKSLPKTIELNLVCVREPDPPAGAEPIEWRLWTSEPIETQEQILRVVDIYLRRWLIEDYIKALKSGCRVQERELESRKALIRLVGLMAPVAWHMLRIRDWARMEPSRPVGELLPASMMEVLRQASVRRPLPEHPTVQETFLAIAGLGGHLKHNGPPGFLVLARGYHDLLRLHCGAVLGRQADALRLCSPTAFPGDV